MGDWNFVLVGVTSHKAYPALSVLGDAINDVSVAPTISVLGIEAL